jgi:hypothetical protein
MVLNPPSQLPQWASQDQLDPVSNQNNVLEPPLQQKQFGWARQQFPPRNWFNWLGRLTYQWLAYLSQNNAKSRTVVTFCNVSGGNSDAPIVTVPLTALRPIVMIYINDVHAGNNSSFYTGIYTLNNSSSVTPNTIAQSHITVGNVDKTTGILLNIVSDLAPNAGPFNIIAVQYDSFF